MTMTIAKIAESYRAEIRARITLQLGNPIVAERCGGAKPRYFFTGWDGHWICSSTRNDISPYSVIRLNGEPASFRDPPWWHGKIDPTTGRPFGDHGTHMQATEFALSSDCEDQYLFLSEWTAGNAAHEWPEFYRELAREQTLKEISGWGLG